MKYKKMLNEDFKTARVKFELQGYEPEDIDIAFDAFKRLKNSNVITKDEANIDLWANKRLSELLTFIRDKEKILEKNKEEKRIWNEERAKYIVVDDNETYKALVPCSELASLKYGSKKWCCSWPTNSEFNASFCSEVVIIFVTIKSTNDKYALITVDREIPSTYVEIWDENNKYIDSSTFTARTGLNAIDIVNKTKSKFPEIINYKIRLKNHFVSNGIPIPKFTEYEHEDRLPEDDESEIAKNPLAAAAYVMKVLNRLGVEVPDVFKRSILSDKMAYRMFTNYGGHF